MHVRQTENRRWYREQLSACLTAYMISVRGMNVSMRLPKKCSHFQCCLHSKATERTDAYSTFLQQRAEL